MDPETPGFKFDRTISVGTLIQTVILTITLVGIYTNLSDRLTKLDTKVDVMWQSFISTLSDSKQHDVRERKAP